MPTMEHGLNSVKNGQIHIVREVDMSEQNNHDLENKFKESLNGNMLENAMDFMSFMKEFI